MPVGVFWRIVAVDGGVVADPASGHHTASEGDQPIAFVVAPERQLSLVDRIALKHDHFFIDPGRGDRSGPGTAWEHGCPERGRPDVGGRDESEFIWIERREIKPGWSTSEPDQLQLAAGEEPTRRAGPAATGRRRSSRDLIEVDMDAEPAEETLEVDR